MIRPMNVLSLILSLLALCATTRAATINVAPGGNVKQTVESANDGDVVKIADGRFDKVNEVRVPNGVTVTFAATREGPTLVTDNGVRGAFIIPNGGKNIRIEGLTCDGPFVFDDGDTSDVIIRWNTITNYDRGKNTGYGSGVAIGNPYGTKRNWKVTNNRFGHGKPGANRPEGWGFGSYRLYNFVGAWNEFDGCMNPWKCNNSGAGTDSVWIINNYITHWRRMTAEFQGQWTNAWMTDNYMDHPVPSSVFNDNTSHFVDSFIPHGDKTENINWLRNTIIIEESERGDGTGARLADEGGTGHTARDNYIEGVGTVFSCFMGDTSGPRPTETIRPSVFENNRVIRAKWGIGGSYGQYPSKATFRNNGPDVKLTWDDGTGAQRPKRGHPRRDETWSGVVTPPTTKPNDPPSNPSAFTISATKLDATADIKTDGAFVRFNLANVPAGTVRVRIEGSTPNGDSSARFGPTPTFDASAFPVTQGGYHPAWEGKWRAVALSATGATLGTSEWSGIIRVAGEIGPNGSELAWPPTKPTTQPTDPPPTTQPAGENADIIIKIRDGKYVGVEKRAA